MTGGVPAQEHQPWTRGVLFPARLPTFERRPPEDGLAHLIRWFWISRWNIEPGRVSRQELLQFSGVNLVVVHTGVEVSGATTRRSHRDLEGHGWAVGALLRPAATPAVCGGEAAGVLDTLLHRKTPDLLDPVAAAMNRAKPDLDAACTHLGTWLAEHVGDPDNDDLLANALLDAIDSDPGITRVEHAAAAISVSVRTAQRLMRRYVGLTPVDVIRRRRLQEAAERLRTEPATRLADLAADLGYADQAHLVRDFRQFLDFTPGRYRSGQAGHPSPPD